MTSQINRQPPLNGNNLVFTEQDIYWQRYAIQLAKNAARAGEVPVGAVLILDNEIIGEGYNRPIQTNDPSAHAEMIALRMGGEKLGNYRLLNTKLYVTLEPCCMCAGAMVHARIQELIYGALDYKSGSVVSRAQLLDQPFLNHKISHAGGLLAQSCGELLSEFFRFRR
jgi:tRNA(adenine34) deaminase